MNRLTISSQQKTASSSSNSNFTVALNSIDQYQRVKRIVPIVVQFQNVFYNVRTGSDDILKVKEAGQTAFNVTVPEGFYEITDLMTNLQTQINAGLVGGTVAITLGAQTSKITFTFTSTTAIVYYTDSTIAPSLGITANSSETASFTAQGFPQLGGLEGVYVISKALAPSKGVQSSGIQGVGRNLLMVVPVDAGFGGLNTYRSTDDTLDEVMYDKPQQINFVDIRLENLEGELIDLDNTHFFMELKVEYELR